MNAWELYDRILSLGENGNVYLNVKRPIARLARHENC